MYSISGWGVRVDPGPQVHRPACFWYRPLQKHLLLSVHQQQFIKDHRNRLFYSLKVKRLIESSEKNKNLLELFQDNVNVHVREETASKSAAKRKTRWIKLFYKDLTRFNWSHRLNENMFSTQCEHGIIFWPNSMLKGLKNVTTFSKHGSHISQGRHAPSNIWAEVNKKQEVMKQITLIPLTY